MKKKSSSLFLIAICSSFISCKPILKVLMGVKQPRIESNASIMSFVKRNGIQSDQVFYIDSTASWTFWKQHKMENLSDLIIFNHKGELLSNLPKSVCTGNVEKTLKSIDISALKPSLLATEDLQKVLNKFRRIDNSKVNVNDFNVDFIVVIYCLKPMGNQQFKNTALAYTNELMLNPSYPHLKILYMNTDMHESWGIKTKDDPRYMIFDY